MLAAGAAHRRGALGLRGQISEGVAHREFVGHAPQHPHGAGDLIGLRDADDRFAQPSRRR
jgi:hypothetical protein